MRVTTQYASSGDLRIAYQVVGAGPLDIVFVPTFASNIEGSQQVKGILSLGLGLASFSRLISFDRRGVRAVMLAAGAERPALLSALEGSALSVVFAATYPELVRALVMFTPIVRAVAGPGYEFAPSRGQHDAWVRDILEHWGSDSQQNPWARYAGDDQDVRRALVQMQRLSMSPAQAAAAFMASGEIDVRHVLPTIQCPTLVLRRAEDTLVSEGHSRYVADHVRDTRFVEFPGAGPIWAGDVEPVVAEVQRFLTGTRRPERSSRVLATVLFTDVVGSTERAASLGDVAWRSLISRHDRVVRDEVGRQGGRVVKFLGDGALATFDGPSRGIASAAAIREGARALGLEIRAGLHSGECELLTNGDIGGLAVNIGARISALAEPGEVLVSGTVRDLIVGSDIAVIDHGEHILKGVPGRWRIFRAGP